MINPVAVEIAGFSIRWYGIAWAISFLIIMYLPSHYVKRARWSSKWQDFVTNVLLAGIIGGRIGSVVVSQPHQFYHDPLLLFRIWKGGMSFFGAILLGGLYVSWYARKHKISFLELSDAGLIHFPIAIGIVRIANFINGELWGRLTNQSWGFHFPSAGPLLRHPSQLYEACLEGLVLWGILYLVSIKTDTRGNVTVAFGLFYGLFRLVIESYFRAPSYDLGTLISTGQLFSLLMIISSIIIAIRAKLNILNDDDGLVSKPISRTMQ